MSVDTKDPKPEVGIKTAAEWKSHVRLISQQPTETLRRLAGGEEPFQHSVCGEEQWGSFARPLGTADHALVSKTVQRWAATFLLQKFDQSNKVEIL